MEIVIRIWIVAISLCWVFPAPAQAHELGVLKVYLEAQDSAHYTLRTPLDGLRPEYFPPPLLPSGCTTRMEVSGNWVVHWIECASEKLDPTSVLVLPWQREGALVFARWQNGQTSSQFFTRGSNGIEIHLQSLNAPGSTGIRMAGHYVVLGIQHILMGIDHLLFIVGLLLLVQGKWMLIKTITSFTLAHSITLALAVFGIFWLSTALVDALIALSIVFVATESVYALSGQKGLSQRMPWAIAFVFGLLHGLGFAGALKALDLPGRELPLALFTFNVGVEAGHLLFIGALYLTLWSIRQVSIYIPSWGRLGTAYAIGALAMFWFITRIYTLAGHWGLY